MKNMMFKKGDPFKGLFTNDFWSTIEEGLPDMDYLFKKTTLNWDLGSHVEKDGKLYFQLDVPGVKKENINIRLDKNYLSINWNRDGSKHEKHFPLNGSVVIDKTEATLEDGVLTIVLTRQEPVSSARTIPIK